MQDSLFYEIALTQIFMVGPRTARTLIENMGSAEAVFKEDPNILKKIGNVGSYLADEAYRSEALKRAEEEMLFIEKNNIKAISYRDEAFSQRLAQCNDAPLVLYQSGNCDLNNAKFLSIVGTRKITKYGKDITSSLIKELSKTNNNVVIVSGLAYGVDITAHRAALDYGVKTIGIVAHGLDRLYPAAHRQVASNMIQQGGAVVTEFLSRTNPDPQNFVQRNRIVAGLCDAVIVIESANKGGALITANLGNDYNRDVFAFPGRVNDEASAGCNSLIRNNKAQLITSADDLISIMGWDNTKSVAAQQQLFADELPDEQQQIINLLNGEAKHINQISTSINMPIQKTSALLTEMVFSDLIEQLPGDVFAKKGI